ncbi:hypothetical protein EBB79_13210 [Parasedimentitalea marina]|uniref:Uncharacterized protein n=1 Tax=Parasedimentitalea marina TaxID=2483033 RepID=A0A3T0N3Y9_9RHOB|nr:hypothetical protein [Parasedimentitalea marina]AZV78735.1 hypothetical protein EBB79_13210 [Parasedimentitalea marina]
MTELLSPDHRYELLRFNGLRVYLEDQGKRNVFTEVIVSFRDDNQQSTEFLNPHFQVEVIKGYLLFYGDDLKDLVNQIFPQASDSDKENVMEMIARYYIDVVDGHIQ